MGRHESNTLRVDSLHVSANHCKINLQRASSPDVVLQATVTDRSRNGTWIATRVGKHSWRTKKLKLEEARQLPENSLLLLGPPLTESHTSNQLVCPGFLFLRHPEPRLIEIRSFKQAELLLDKRDYTNVKLDQIPVTCPTSTASLSVNVESAESESRKRLRQSDLDDRREFRHLNDLSVEQGMLCDRSLYSCQQEEHCEMQRNERQSGLGNNAVKRFKDSDADAPAVIGKCKSLLTQVATAMCRTECMAHATSYRDIGSVMASPSADDESEKIKAIDGTKAHGDASCLSIVDRSDLCVDTRPCEGDYDAIGLRQKFGCLDGTSRSETSKGLDMKETLLSNTKTSGVNGVMSPGLEEEKIDASRHSSCLGGREMGDHEEDEDEEDGDDDDDDDDEEEHCIHCLKLFKLSLLIEHAEICREKERSQMAAAECCVELGGDGRADVKDEEEEELCGSCLRPFKLSELIGHVDVCWWRTAESTVDVCSQHH